MWIRALARVPPAFIGTAVLAAVYAALPAALVASDTVPHRLTALSVVCDRDFDLFEFAPVTIEADGSFPYFLSPGPDGRLLSAFEPWTGLVAAPVFSAAAAVDASFSPRRLLNTAHVAAIVLTVIAAAFVTAAVRVVAGNTAALLLGVAGYGLGTTAFSLIGRALWQHTAAAPFVAAGVYGIVARGPARASPWVGAALTAAGVLRPPLLPVAAGLTIWLAASADSRRRAALLAAAALVPPAAHAAYSVWAFHAPFAFAQSAAGAVKAAEHLGGAAAWFGGGAAGVLTAAIGLLVSPSRGLLVFSPFSALGFVAVAGPAGDRAVPRAFASAFAALWMVYACRTDWWGGWSFGPRYLHDALPFAVVLAAFGLRALTTPLRRAAFGAALLWSVALHTAGALRYDQVLWDASPNVDSHPERLWSIADSQPAFYLLGTPAPAPPTIDNRIPDFRVCPVRFDAAPAD